MAEKDVEYNVHSTGSDSPDPYEVSADNTLEVRTDSFSLYKHRG